MIRRHGLVGLLGGLALVLPGFARAQDIAQDITRDVTEVVVRDAEFQVVRKLTSVEELAAFQKIWSTRAKDKDAIVSEPHFKLDVRYGNRGARWLYDPRGFVQMLTIWKAPVYRLSSPEEFNTLLGISQSGNPTAPTPR